jgi:hypothetical protein
VVDAFGQAASMLAENGIEFSVPNTCNSTVFAQIPGHRDYFLGRIRGNGGPCPSSQRELPGVALFQMDWSSHTLNFRRVVVQPSTMISAGRKPTRIHHAYDPSVAAYRGELWVAFECATGASSTCVGPLDWNTGTIDPRRITEAVRGVDADPRSGFAYTASTPNIFVFGGRLYVYWSAIKIRKADHNWEQITIRGMELREEPAGLRRMWGAGSGEAPVAAYDPARNIEVAGLDPADPYSNQSIDIKGVYIDENNIYLMTSLGGKGPGEAATCVNGRGTSHGCWRLQIFRSSNPLQPDGFNRHPLIAPKLPLNPASYQRSFVAPDGTLYVVGGFKNPADNRRVANMLYVPSKTGSFVIAYPLPVARLQFK